MAADVEPEDAEAVRDGREVWVGLERFASATLQSALRLCAVRDVGDGDRCERYAINDIGRAIIADPAQATALRRHLLAGENMTVAAGRIVRLPDPCRP